MIEFEKFTLNNGLRVLVHTDRSTPMVAVNVMYNVGSKNEQIDKTGFAHLFEHLMFGGSENIKDFDGPIQMAGGENNAFTNADVTNFYNVLPAKNIETAFWLESDRMNQLAFSEKNLEKEKRVVLEEFKETCLNQPYGQVWHHLTAMAYKQHPYRWPTIGLIPEHIENASLEDVKAFFYKFYRPNNAILVVSGDVSLAQIEGLAEKWFGTIQKGESFERNIPIEPAKNQIESKYLKESIPSDSIYLSWAMCSRLDPDYHATDLLSDALASGRSSRLYQRLKKDKPLFASIDAYISGSMDPGLFIIEGKPMPDVSIQKAKAAIFEELDIIKSEGIQERELEKLKNKVENGLVFSEVSILNKAINLAIYELLGDAHLINKQSRLYQNVDTEDIKRMANKIFTNAYNELVYEKLIIDN